MSYKRFVKSFALKVGLIFGGILLLCILIIFITGATETINFVGAFLMVFLAFAFAFSCLLNPVV